LKVAGHRCAQCSAFSVNLNDIIKTPVRLVFARYMSRVIIYLHILAVL